MVGKRYPGVLGALSALLLLAACAAPGRADWRAELRGELARLGSRNLVAVVGSSYPDPARESVRVLATNASQVEVLRELLAEIRDAQRLRASVTLDRELEYVPEADAAGIQAHREALRATLAGLDVSFVPHEDLLARIAKTAQDYDVLVLRTDLALPYCTVLLTLDAAGWSAAAEARLRETMAREAREGILR